MLESLQPELRGSVRIFLDALELREGRLALKGNVGNQVTLINPETQREETFMLGKMARYDMNEVESIKKVVWNMHRSRSFSQEQQFGKCSWSDTDFNKELGTSGVKIVDLWNWVRDKTHNWGKTKLDDFEEKLKDFFKKDDAECCGDTEDTRAKLDACIGGTFDDFWLCSESCTKHIISKLKEREDNVAAQLMDESQVDYGLAVVEATFNTVGDLGVHGALNKDISTLDFKDDDSALGRP